MTGLWDLNDIYESFDSPAFQSDFKSVEKTAKRLNVLADSLNEFTDAAALVELLESYVSVYDRISNYAGFVSAVDTSNKEASKYIYKLETVNADINRVKVKLAEYLSKLPAPKLKKAAADSGLGDYAFILRRMAKEHSHLMSEAEETLAAKLITTGSSAWVQLHDKLISNLTCEYADPKNNGEVRSITITECRNFAYDADAKVRKAGYVAWPRIRK